ncbi:hypothetical protein EI94DRAFT_1745881 [Lactarius quietus]|nr:hypothetical protein EI94DRAFT_1745881 [Lactarius quietus]
MFLTFGRSAAKITSMNIYREVLEWTLDWLNEDRELEEFVSGIPGLRESEALIDWQYDGTDPRCTIRAMLAALPGPQNFHAPLPWTIIRLAQRAMTSSPSKPIPRQRIKVCLKALYCIPGAIRDLLAPYSGKKIYCLEILPLLSSIESLEVIGELWDDQRDDIAISVRCAAAVIYSFMITPPRTTLDKFLPSNVPFIGDIPESKGFLSKRLAGVHPSSSHPDPDADLHSDNARLQNLGRFLEDIKVILPYIDMVSWATNGDSVQSICQERRVLFNARKTEEFRAGKGVFEQHGHRESPVFLLEEVARAQLDPQTPDQSLVQSFAWPLSQSLPQSLGASLPSSPTQVPEEPSQSESLAQPTARALTRPPLFFTHSLWSPLHQSEWQKSPRALLQRLLPKRSQSLPLAQEPTLAASSSAHVEGVEMGRMSRRVPQQVTVEECVGILPQTEGQTMAASAGPSRLSRVSSLVTPSSSLRRAADPGDRSLSESADVLV